MTEAGAAQDSVDSATIAYQRAMMLADVGRLDDALATVEDALSGHPDDLQLRAAEAWLLLKIGRVGESRELLAEIVAEVPNQAWAYLLLSVAEQELEKLPAATDAAARALELEPSNPKYHLQVAGVAVTGSISKADRALAEERVTTALELEPDDPGILLTVAQVYRALGETETAKGFVARGLAIAPEDQALHYFRAVLAGDYTPVGRNDYKGLVHVADQVTAMSEVLGMSPGNIEANQVLFGRVWGQLLRLIDTPLVMIGVVAITVGYVMGTGPALNTLYVGAGLAVAWPLFRFFTTRAVLARASKGYLSRMVRGGSFARTRMIGSYVALGAGVVGVLCLIWLREASLVRWLLLLLAVASIGGGVATVLWYKRYFDAALETGIFAPTALGFRSIRIARKSVNGRLAWRAFVVVVAGIPAAMMVSLTRADAGPVLVLAVSAWAAPAVYSVWRVRRMSLTLADDLDAPKDVTPSVIGGPLVGLVTLALLANALFATAQLPWTPSERDAAGVYVLTPSTGTSECTGRPASRLGCIIRENEERMDEIIEDMEEIEVPSIDIPEIDIPDITVPTITPPPAIVTE